MAVASRAELIAALSADNPARLLGAPESQWLELKRDPYPLTTERGKWELAKDVAALANAPGGGLIVLGVRAERRPHEIAEVAVEAQGVKRSLVNPQQYRDVLTDRLRPGVDVHLHWLPAKDREDGLFFIIEVETFSDPGLVVLRRMIDENDRQIEAVGIPRRHTDRIEWVSADEVSRLVADGFRGRAQAVQATGAHRGVDHVRAAERVSDVESWQEWKEVPVYFIQAIPPQGTSLVSSLLEPDGVRGALERPECLRPFGWNLRTEGYTEVRDGALAYLPDPRRAVLVDPEALFTVGAVAHSGYLAWAQRAPLAGQPEVLHPLSLVEFTFEVMRFLHAEIVPRGNVGTWTLRVICRRFLSGSGVALRPGPMSTWYGLEDPRMATRGEWEHTFESSRDPARDAFEALRRVYLLFGLDSSAIPYREGDAISADAIKAVHD